MLFLTFEKQPVWNSKGQFTIYIALLEDNLIYNLVLSLSFSVLSLVFDQVRCALSLIFFFYYYFHFTIMNCFVHRYSLVPRVALCRADEFQCLDGTCVSQTARCDGRSDCRDRSDETNCTGTIMLLFIWFSLDRGLL